MDQQTINKLMEIKKLYEAGILTKEEMEAEKNKVLHPEGIVSEEPKAEEPISEEISSDATPVMTDSEGRFVFDEPKQKPTQTNSSSSQQTSKSNSELYWIGVIGILVLIIVLLALSGSKNNTPTYYSEEAPETATDSVRNDEPTTITAEDEPKVEVTETGAWAGRIVIEGGMYRICMTSAAISLVSDGNNRYHGTIKIHAGEGLNGYLEGDIIASGSDTELTIHIIEPYVAPGDNGNVFDEPEFYKPIQKNSDIFRLTKQGNSYSAKPLGNMKDYFDGIADEITVNKK